MKPEWIAPGAKLAHQLGLHVHGHIPAGMRTLDAINAGYDEITHIYFATMQAMPQEVVDLDAEPTKTVIATMAAKKIVLDPTWSWSRACCLPRPGPWRPLMRPMS